MNRLKKVLIALLLLGISGMAPAATRYPDPSWKEGPDPDASPYAQPGGTLLFAGFDPPKSFNGYLDNNSFTITMFGLLYPSLLAIDTKTGEYGPSLADWWEVSDDKRTYTFHIDERAHWSDGSPVTAHDVKATFDAVMAPKSITGTFKMTLAPLESPVIIDDNTLSFHCTETHWRNLSSIGGSLFIMPKKLIDRARETCRAEGRDEAGAFNEINFNLDIVGGPYRVTEHKEGASVTLTRRPDWWCFSTPGGRGVYNFETVKISFFTDRNNAYEAFKKGVVDFFPVYSARQWFIESVGEVFDKNWIVKQNIHNHEPIGFQGVAMNMRRQPYDDIRVRKAMAHLFDRRWMVRTLMYNSYFMMRSYFTDLYDKDHPCETPLFEYDPEEALRLLTEAGFARDPETGKMTYPIYRVDGQSGEKVEIGRKPFVVNILSRSPSDKIHLARYKESLARLGIDLTINVRDTATWSREMENYNFDMTSSGFTGALFRDPEPMWHSRYKDAPNGSNFPGFADPEVDRLIESQKTEFSGQRRNEILRQIDRIVTAAVPNILTWNVGSKRLLYWNKFGVPNTILGKYGDEMSILTYWWYDADSARELQEAMRDNQPLPSRPFEVYYDAFQAEPASSPNL